MVRIGWYLPDYMQETVCPLVKILNLDSLQQLLLSLMSEQTLRQLSEIKLEQPCHSMNIYLLQNAK